MSARRATGFPPFTTRILPTSKPAWICRQSPISTHRLHPLDHRIPTRMMLLLPPITALLSSKTPRSASRPIPSPQALQFICLTVPSPPLDPAIRQSSWLVCGLILRQISSPPREWAAHPTARPFSPASSRRTLPRTPPTTHSTLSSQHSSLTPCIFTHLPPPSTHFP